MPEEAYDKLKLTEDLCNSFAIKFTDFCNKYYTYKKYNTWLEDDGFSERTTNELLTIYKNQYEN